jgi:membrane-bound lytic murein transglycosylase MltF
MLSNQKVLDVSVFRSFLLVLIGAIVGLLLQIPYDVLGAEEADAEQATPAQEDIEASEAILRRALKPWTGDFDGMRERGMIRVLVVYNRIYYFLDRYRERGLTYEAMKLFETEINKELKLRSTGRIHVVFIPVTRDRLIPSLVEGIGDLAAANLTITPGRLEHVDFSAPITDKVQEVLVAGTNTGAVASIDDLAGREIVVRRSSSYYDSLIALNKRLRADGKAELRVTLADENLEDDAIAEMVNAELYPATVIDLHKAQLYERVFPKIVVHRDIVLRDGGEIGWAFRKDSPLLADVVDRFVGRHKVGKQTANILIKRYLDSTKFVKNALTETERKKFAATVDIFKKYADQFDFDWLLLVAQGYQESGLDQTVKSKAGAVGIMQVMPSTAKAPPISIPDISTADPNIRAGAKYLRHVVDQYFNDPGISALDRQLFAFASYNAGPNRVDRLRRKAAALGLDPNRWFNNVEIVVSKSVGREPVDYVDNIFKYYIAFRRAQEMIDAQEKAKGVGHTRPDADM